MASNAEIETFGGQNLSDLDSLNEEIPEDNSDESIIMRRNIYFFSNFNFYLWNLDDIWGPKSPAESTSTSQMSQSARIHLQLAAYKQIRIPRDSDIFEWWKQSSPQFPDLTQLARVVHSIPSTSICSERLFSKAGLIYANRLRNL
jgi:hypothetical protein